MTIRRFRNGRGTSWEISLIGTTVTEFWCRDGRASTEREKTKELSSKAEAQRFMKSRIAAQTAAGFVDEATHRAELRSARDALKERIAGMKVAMKSPQRLGTSAKSTRTSKRAVTAPSSVETQRQSRPNREPVQRNLVHRTGGSNKFWKVVLKGSVITTSWGRIGTNGSSKSERSSSPGAAEEKFAALVKAKLAKGYVVANEDPARPAAGRTRKSAAAKSGASIPTGASSAAPTNAPSALPPSYVDWVRKQEAQAQPRRFPRFRKRRQVGPELERTVEPNRRRSKKLPGYPSRLVIYPPERLSAAQKVFIRSLIPLSDLTTPVDHSHLLIFGHDTEHTSMCWDPTARKPTGEMLICFIDGDEGDRRTDAGYNLSRIVRAYGPSDFHT